MHEEWREDAACKGVDNKYFFDWEYYDFARETWCNDCPVAQHCLEYALEPREVVWTAQGRGALVRGEDHGLWGGMTPNERDEYAGMKVYKPGRKR